MVSRLVLRVSATYSAQALLLAGNDVGGFHHHHAVELETLDDADRHHGDAHLQAGAGGLAVLDASGLEGARHVVEHHVRNDDSDVALAHIGIEFFVAETTAASRSFGTTRTK